MKKVLIATNQKIFMQYSMLANNVTIKHDEKNNRVAAVFAGLRQ
jgi:hypothetical protein